MKNNKYLIFLLIFVMFISFIVHNKINSTFASNNGSNNKISFNISEINSSVATFNRYTIIYTSEVYVKGIITYKINGIEEKERFYLEPAKNYTFSSFISGYIDNQIVNSKDIVSVEFERISQGTGTFNIHSVELVSYPQAKDLIDWISGDLKEKNPVYEEQKTIFIGNNNIKLGLSMRYGGSINYIAGNSNIFSEKFANINLINNYDNGRLIQQCYYGNQTYSSNRFVSGTCDNIDGLYNPIQGGYVKRNCEKNINSEEREEYNSKIIDIGISEDKKTIVIKTKPSLWELTNNDYKEDYYDYYGGYTTESYMTSEYQIYDTYIDVSNSYIDFTDNFSETYSTIPERKGSVRSESPSVYTIAALDTFYKNNISTSTIEKIEFGQITASGLKHINNQNPIYTNWGGYYSTNHETNITEGLGLYYPNYDGSHQYISGFVYPGSNSSSTSSLSDSTSFFSMIIHLWNGNIDKFKKVSYDYVITLGNINNIQTIMNKYRQEHTYKLKVDPNGGTINGSMNSITYEPNLIAYWGNWNKIGIASRPGYILTGYYDSKTEGNKVYDSSGMAYHGLYWKVNSDDLLKSSLVEEKYQYIGNQDLTVYARWEAKPGTTDEYLFFDKSLEINKDNKFVNLSETKLTASKLLEKIEILEPINNIVLYNSDESLKTNNNLIATGDIIKIYTNNKEQTKYLISVLGDTTGDGEITNADVAKIYQNYRKKISMEEIYISAGDVKKDHEINLSDVAKLYQYIRKKINILK